MMAMAMVYCSRRDEDEDGDDDDVDDDEFENLEIKMGEKKIRRFGVINQKDNHIVSMVVVKR